MTDTIEIRKEKIEKTFLQLSEKHPESYQSFLLALKKERVYQENIWNDSTTETSGSHTLPEWAVSIYEYTNEARAHISRNPEPFATEIASDCLRKVAAMIWSAAEQHDFVDSLAELDNGDILTDIQSVNELLCYLQYPINKLSECFFNGANRDNQIFTVLFGQIFISIVDTVSKTDKVVFRPEN